MAWKHIPILKITMILHHYHSVELVTEPSWRAESMGDILRCRADESSKDRAKFLPIGNTLCKNCSRGCKFRSNYESGRSAIETLKGQIEEFGANFQEGSSAQTRGRRENMQMNKWNK